MSLALWHRVFEPCEPLYGQPVPQCPAMLAPKGSLVLHLLAGAQFSAQPKWAISSNATPLGCSLAGYKAVVLCYSCNQMQLHSPHSKIIKCHVMAVVFGLGNLPMIPHLALTRVLQIVLMMPDLSNLACTWAVRS